MKYFRKKINIFLFIHLLIFPILGQEAEKIKEKPVIQINKIEENKQVSRALSNLPHYGVMSAANPIDSKNLITAGVIFDKHYAHPSISIYFSFDGGKSWEKSSIDLDYEEELKNPILTFDSDGRAYFSCLSKNKSNEEKYQFHFSLYRSEDGGKSWSVIFRPEKDYLFEWHSILVNQTVGKYNQRLYLLGTRITERETKKNLTIYYSDDKGASFKGPVKEIENVATFNGGILSDGTIIILYASKGLNNNLVVTTSPDGTKSFTSPVEVAKIHHTKIAAISRFPSLAVDKNSQHFRNRIYVTWLDDKRGCYDVYFSWSSDMGRTWSSPLIINDNPPSLNPQEGPDHTCPAVAVNKHGVVGIIWYDRRDDGFSKESIFTGPTRIVKDLIEQDYRWQIYFSTSLDGGESFLSNEKVSTALFSNNAPGNWALMSKIDRLSFYLPQNIYPGAGNGGCFVASPDGRFHAIWVDSRSGISQIWTTPIEVNEKAYPNGSEENASLEDISLWIGFNVTNTKFVPRDRIFEFYVYLENKSKDLIFLVPLKVRLLSINSEFGSWEVLKAENEIKGAGAVWDFSRMVSTGKLEPGEISGRKHIFLKLKDEISVNFLRSPKLLDLKTKVIGKKYTL